MINHFRTLGVKSNATDDEIKKAYRRLSQTLHPDKLIQASAEEQSQAATQLARVQEAYAVLSDPKQRAAFLKDFQSQIVTEPHAAMHALWDQYYPDL